MASGLHSAINLAKLLRDNLETAPGEGTWYFFRKLISCANFCDYFVTVGET